MGFVRNVVGGITGSTAARASRQAAALQAQSADSAIAEQRAARMQAAGFLSPYANAGRNVLRDLENLTDNRYTIGLPQARLAPLDLRTLPDIDVGRVYPEYQRPSDYSQATDLQFSNNQYLPSVLPGDIGQDSLFQSLKQQAISGIESSAAARGKLFSGTTPQAIAERVQNLALARAGDIQQQNLAARQQLMGESSQLFGESLAARQQMVGESDAQFAQRIAARQQFVGESQQQFARNLALREAMIGERGTLYAQELGQRQAMLGERISEQERQYNQLFNIAQLGQAAAAGQAANVQSAAGNIGGLLTQQGNALAAGIVGSANARSQFGQALIAAAVGRAGGSYEPFRAQPYA